MKSTNNPRKFAFTAALATLALTAAIAPSAASATTLNASAGGTFTFNFDHSAFNEYVFGAANNGTGFYLSRFFNTADSDYTTKSDGYFLANNDYTPDSSAAFVHDVTAVSATNPTGQQSGRFVKSTTTNFSINSSTLAGTGTLGMTGVQDFRLPFYSDGTTSLLFGDFSLKYGVASRQGAWDDLGQTGTPSGWYLTNNISFSAVAYDLTNLVVAYTDANNWSFSGDLLMSPENADFLVGTRLKDVGNFCLGIGSYAGCSNPAAVASVPVPSAIWFMGSGMIGLLAARRGRRGVAV